MLGGQIEGENYRTCCCADEVADCDRSSRADSAACERFLRNASALASIAHSSINFRPYNACMCMYVCMYVCVEW